MIAPYYNIGDLHRELLTMAIISVAKNEGILEGRTSIMTSAGRRRLVSNDDSSTFRIETATLRNYFYSSHGSRVSITHAMVINKPT